MKALQIDHSWLFLPEISLGDQGTLRGNTHFQDTTYVTIVTGLMLGSKAVKLMPGNNGLHSYTSKLLWECGRKGRHVLDRVAPYRMMVTRAVEGHFKVKHSE